MRKLTIMLPLAAVALFSSTALADDLTGADGLLCSASTIVACGDDGECETLFPEDLNLPQFIEVDLKGKRLATTKASGLNRATPIQTLTRADGRIVVQGFEGGRAFSFVVDERSGHLTAAIARSSIAVSVFGSCTTLPASK
jgi:hypothetical protein